MKEPFNLFDPYNETHIDPYDKVYMELYNKMYINLVNNLTFVLTVLATLPIRTASQGESFALESSKTNNNTPSMPLSDAHLGGFFFLGL